MAWPKIKNIIILILLVTNLGLLTFTASREVRARQLQDEARSDAIAFLQQKGIELDGDQVPRTMTLQPMLVTRDLEREGVLAAALLEGAVSVQARGADVYRYYNENGSIQFHSSGEFSAYFSGGAQRAGTEDWVEQGKKTLEKLDFQGELLDSQGDRNNGTLTFRETWKGVPLLSCQASLNYEDGVLVSITGARRLTGEPEANSAGSSITVATALMKFYTGLIDNEIGDVCREIRSITQAYTVTTALSGPAALVPVWYITTDTGAAYQLDLLEGTLSRAVRYSADAGAEAPDY